MALCKYTKKGWMRKYVKTLSQNLEAQFPSPITTIYLVIDEKIYSRLFDFATYLFSTIGNRKSFLY